MEIEEKIKEKIDEVKEESGYGKVTILIQDKKVVLITKETTEKI